jgi:hypothetical protein
MFARRGAGRPPATRVGPGCRAGERVGPPGCPRTICGVSTDSNEKPGPPGLAEALEFPLSTALTGRRSRRFAAGATIPDGPFAHRSTGPPLALDGLETILLLSGAAGNTGWHHLLPHSTAAGGRLPSYAVLAGGRTIASAGGFQTSELFFTDDAGVYVFETRRAPALVERTGTGAISPGELLAAHRRRVRKLRDGRLHLRRDRHVSPHNAWAANVPGSTVLIPVADVSHAALALLWIGAQGGTCVYDDRAGAPIPGLERFRHRLDVGNPWPLTALEQEALAMCAAEQAMMCQAGALVCEAMGLGGWIFSGMDGLAVLGASGDPDVPGLGFRFDRDARWPLPNATGLAGVMEGFCPPHAGDMRAAVDRLVEWKFGPGGPYRAETPGPFRNPAVRGMGVPADPELVEIVATTAAYVHARFGRFPGTVPTMLVTTYLQAHHLDLAFYDRFYEPGAYLQTHERHMASWHGEGTGATGPR